MTAEGFKFDPDLEWSLLEASLKEVISRCIKEKRCIPLPLEVGPEPAIMLMNSLQCEMCNAHCCRYPGTNNPEQAFVLVSESEKRMMIQDGAPRSAFKTSVKNGRSYTYMKYPCPLLKDNRCSVYDFRPISCQRYPIQVSYPVDGSMPSLAMDSGCTQAPGVAMDVYRRIYEAKNKGKI